MEPELLPLDPPATIINGHTMIPVSALGSLMHIRVIWDPSKDTIFLLTPGHKNLTVEYLDVGQGDSILLTSGGESMLIDAGETGDQVLEYVYGTRQDQLKYLVATHPDADHIGGMDEVLTLMPTHNMLMPNATANTFAFSSMLHAIDSRKLTPIIPQKGDVYSLGKAKVTVIASEVGSTSNDSSLVLKAEYGDTSFLFMGDAEESLEQSILNSGTDIQCDVLKVGHHGSDTSTSDAFLATAAPKTAIISCGKDNPYGHPSAEVLNKLSKSKTSVWRTDVSGNIVVITNSKGNTYQVTTHNQKATPEESFFYPEQSNRNWYLNAFPFICKRPFSWDKPTIPPPPDGSTVYIGSTGDRYHYDPNCVKLTEVYYKTRLEIVDKKGFVPCTQCVADLPEYYESEPEPEPIPASEPNYYYEPEPNYYDEPEPDYYYEPEEPTIYITRTGKRYHYNPHCNGGTYYESTLEEALSRGLTPCDKCVLK